MAERELFDWIDSMDRKSRGMEQAADAKQDVLQLARDQARLLGQRQEFVTADDVGKRMWDLYEIDSLGPAAGSIFTAREWEFTGQRVASARKKNHGRELKCWRLKNG